MMNDKKKEIWEIQIPRGVSDMPNLSKLEVYESGVHFVLPSEVV